MLTVTSLLPLVARSASGGSGHEDGEAGSVYISVTATSLMTVTADFAATPVSGSAPLTVTFTNLSISSGETYRDYQWSFGDGSTSALENPLHVYTQTGSFTVTLTATSGNESDVEVKALYIAVYAPPSEPALKTCIITYTYDSLHRLTGANYSSGEEFGYAYDAVGNMTAMTETMSTTVVTTYTHNAAYQLVTARASNDGVTWYYTYDKRGNLVRQTPGSAAPVEGETRYTYDAAGNLARVEFYTAGDYTTLAEAAYNGAGERVRLTTWAAGVPVTVTYAVFDDQLLASDDGSQTTLYLYGRRLIAEYKSEWAYPLRDRDGSARQIADWSGRVSLARTFKPLGGILQEQGAYESVFGYLGAQLDRISGLLYADGRYFDPTTGRFLTPHRRFDAYRPRSLNPYVPWVDPTMLLLGPLMVWATLATGERRRRYGRWTWVLLLLCVAVSVAGCGGEEDEDGTTPTTVIVSVPPTMPIPTRTLSFSEAVTFLTAIPTAPLTSVATPTAREILVELTCTETPIVYPTPTPGEIDMMARIISQEVGVEEHFRGLDHIVKEASEYVAWTMRNRVEVGEELDYPTGTYYRKESKYNPDVFNHYDPFTVGPLPDVPDPIALEAVHSAFDAPRDSDPLDGAIFFLRRREYIASGRTKDQAVQWVEWTSITYPTPGPGTTDPPPVHGLVFFQEW